MKLFWAVPLPRGWFYLALLGFGCYEISYKELFFLSLYYSQRRLFFQQSYIRSFKNFKTWRNTLSTLHPRVSRFTWMDFKHSFQKHNFVLIKNKIFKMLHQSCSLSLPGISLVLKIQIWSQMNDGSQKQNQKSSLKKK